MEFENVREANDELAGLDLRDDFAMDGEPNVQLEDDDMLNADDNLLIDDMNESGAHQ